MPGEFTNYLLEIIYCQAENFYYQLIIKINMNGIVIALELEMPIN
jgi:hypothetical protein